MTKGNIEKLALELGYSGVNSSLSKSQMIEKFLLEQG